MQYKTQEEMDRIKAQELEALNVPAPAGKKVNTGPNAGETFPSTDEWAGKPVTGDYQTIPEDKQAIEENLKRAGEEVQKRFGLETRGVDIAVPNEPNKSGK